jgi:uncharacterized protein
MKNLTSVRAAIVGLLLLPATLAFAQKAPVAALPLDPARVAAAKELMVAKGGADALKRTIAELGAGISADYRTSHPAKAAKIAAALDELLAPDGTVVREYVRQAAEDYTRFYATHFTVLELNELKAFYLTPTGKKAQELYNQLDASAIEPMAKVGQSIQKAVQKVF